MTNQTILSFANGNISCEYVNNRRIWTEFHLNPVFTYVQNQGVIFIVVFLMYVLAVLGNSLIITLVCFVQKLHTPMYFFLCNLSVQDNMYISAILPKLLAIKITGDTIISFSGCITQFFFFAYCVDTEFFLLTCMAYDRYVAICLPLRYPLIMNKIMYISLATSSWLIGTLNPLIVTLMMSKLSFCNVQKINHFYCDTQTMLKLTHSDTTNISSYITVSGVFFGLFPFMLIMLSYIRIISAILKIRTSNGRQKLFSSCSSHLTVVILFYGSCLSLNMKPKSEDSQELDKILSLLYTGAVPMLNPLVYSLRNRDVLKAIKGFLKKNYFDCEIKPLSK